MGLGAAIGGIASGAGGLLSSGAASQASQQQSQAAMMGLMVQEQMAAQARADTAPFRQIGTGAINQLGSLYGINADGTSTQLTPQQQQQNLQNFTQTPDYQFAQQQGTQAVDRSAAASGALNSGAAVKAATEFGQGLASQQYGNYYNRLLSLAQIGTNAATNSATNSLAAGNAQAQTLGNYGTAQASGTIGSANALSGGLQSMGMYGALAGASSYSGGGAGGNSGLGGFLYNALGGGGNPFSGG